MNELHTLMPEEVAQRYGHRPGFRLVNYRETGLPVWRINLKCMTIAHRPIPPLQEFSLRAVDIGLKTATDLGGFLGLPEDVTAATLAALVMEDLILPTQRGNGEESEFVVSRKGRLSLSEMQLLVPEERVYPLHFDGLLRRFFNPLIPLHRPRELRDAGVLEIPPFPADPPSVDEIPISQVESLIASIVSPQEILRDLLSVVGVEGRRERLLLKAVALVFEALEGLDVEVSFVIDGRPSEEHERAFAAAEGARKLGILQALKAETAESVVASVLDPGTISQTVDSAQALRRTAEASRQKAEEARRRLSTIDKGVEQEAASKDVLEASEQLADAEAALAALPVRPLEVYEHPALLREALKGAEDRLLIISPWIRAAVVNADFLKRLEALLSKGVRVLIGYGSGSDELISAADRKAEDRLLDMARHYGNLVLARLGDTHAKVLVVDHQYVIVTSFNWLSFRGDPDKPFRDERGMLVSIPEVIEQVYASFEERIVDATG